MRPDSAKMAGNGQKPNNQRGWSCPNCVWTAFFQSEKRFSGKLGVNQTLLSGQL